MEPQTITEQLGEIFKPFFNDKDVLYISVMFPGEGGEMSNGEVEAESQIGRDALTAFLMNRSNNFSKVSSIKSVISALRHFAYRKSRRSATLDRRDVLRTSIVARLLSKMKLDEWDGSATQWYDDLKKQAEEADCLSEYLRTIKSADALGKHFNELKPSLEAIGILLKYERTKERKWRMKRIASSKTSITDRDASSDKPQPDVSVESS
ncbi:hypothetical protein K2X85_12005 [bacterium]|nr:hypothetical protein [bacterium]